MYEVIIAPRAQRQLKAIERENTKFRISLIIEDLKDNPYIGKKLSRELARRYVYKVGVYRIIYKIKEKECIVEVISAGHRSIVY